MNSESQITANGSSIEAVIFCENEKKPVTIFSRLPHDESRYAQMIQEGKFENLVSTSDFEIWEEQAPKHNFYLLRENSRYSLARLLRSEIQSLKPFVKKITPEEIVSLFFGASIST